MAIAKYNPSLVLLLCQLMNVAMKLITKDVNKITLLFVNVNIDDNTGPVYPIYRLPTIGS
jgi:uncharacterized protein YlaN (UPF0358 family)